MVFLHQHYRGTPSPLSELYHSSHQKVLYLAFFLLLLLIPQHVGEALCDRPGFILDWNAMLHQVSFFNILIVLTEHSMVSGEQICQLTFLFLSDSTLASFLELSLLVIRYLGGRGVYLSDPGCFSLPSVTSC